MTSTASSSAPAIATTSQERVAIAILAAQWPWVDPPRCPFGVDRAEACLRAIGLDELRELILGELRARRTRRHMAAGEPRHMGIDAGMRSLAIARVLWACGGIVSAIRWSHTAPEPGAYSPDLWRWYAESCGVRGGRARTLTPARGTVTEYRHGRRLGERVAALCRVAPPRYIAPIASITMQYLRP